MFPRRITITKYDDKKYRIYVQQYAGDFQRGDILLGGHRVSAVMSDTEIAIYPSKSDNLVPGNILDKVGTYNPENNETINLHNHHENPKYN